MSTKIKLSNDHCPKRAEKRAEMKHIPYREAVGSLMSLTVGTRLDIATAVSRANQFLSNPGRAH